MLYFKAVYVSGERIEDRDAETRIARDRQQADVESWIPHAGS